MGHYKDGGLTRSQLVLLYENGVKRYLRDKQVWFDVLGVKVDLGVSPKSTKNSTGKGGVLTKFKQSDIDKMSDTEKASLSEKQFQEHKRLIALLGSKDLG